jgi:peptide chain release factor 3
VLRTKQFARGLEQLEQEGAVQVLWEADGARSAPILAAVGDLQFDVVMRRLRDEYGAETVLDLLPHQAIRVVTGSGDGVRWPSEGLRLIDRDGRTVILFRSTRDADYFRETYPATGLKRISEA